MKKKKRFPSFLASDCDQLVVGRKRKRETQNNNSNKGEMGLTVEWRTFEVRNGIKGKRAPGTIRSDGL